MADSQTKLCWPGTRWNEDVLFSSKEPNLSIGKEQVAHLPASMVFTNRFFLGQSCSHAADHLNWHLTSCVHSLKKNQPFDNQVYSILQHVSRINTAPMHTNDCLHWEFCVWFDQGRQSL